MELDYVYEEEPDFKMLQQVREDGKPTSIDFGAVHSFVRGRRDYPRFVQDSFQGGVSMGHILDHPMSNGMGWSFSDLVSDVKEAASDLIDQGQEEAIKAATQAAQQAAGNLAVSVLEKPAVQQTLTDQAKAAAVSATAKQITAATAGLSTFWAKNKTYIMIGAGGLVAALIAMKMLKK